MLLTLTLAKTCYLKNFLNKATGIINFGNMFSKLYRRYCDLICKLHAGLKSFWGLNSIMTSCIIEEEC